MEFLPEEPQKGLTRPGPDSRPDMPRMRVRDQWTSAQCVQKVEEMLSRAIIQQEDLWGMLAIHSSEGDHPRGDVKPEDVIPPQLSKALKTKLENSMDWCHLALCRLKEVVVHTSPASTEIVGLHNVWSPGSFFLNEASQLPSGAQSCDGEQLVQQSVGLLVPDGELTQGQRFSRLPSLGLDADWNMLSEAQVSDLSASPPLTIASGAAPIDQPHQTSSSSHGQDANDHADNEDRRLLARHNSHGLRPRLGPKRDREETDEKDTTTSVVFQELKPGDDMKKGIPDDGHRGWKKYGNKAIQNSNFCRGYYKCSMKECRAKKQVQPTDTDPRIFEVTYVGKHTCSSTSRRRNRSRTTAPAPDPTERRSTADNDAGSPDAPHRPKGAPGKESECVQAELTRLLKNHGECSLSDETAQNGQSAIELTTNGSQADADLADGENKHWPSSSLDVELEATRVSDSKEDGDHDDTCLDQSARHQQSVFTLQADPHLLWQEIMNTNHREVWNTLQVET